MSIVCLLLFLGIWKVAAKELISLTGEEKQLAKKIGFDEQILLLIKKEVNVPLYQMTGFAAEMVVSKLKEWEKRYPFQIIGADGDWVEVKFTTAPSDIDAFAQEVYKFCPDVVDQGTGDVEELAKEMKESKTLYLW